MNTHVNRKLLDDNQAQSRPPLHDDIVSRLRQMIIRCELEPGERFTESKLVELFGVSRTPLREALKILASEGLVEMRPHRGSAVARISQDETPRPSPFSALWRNWRAPSSATGSRTSTSRGSTSSNPR